MYIKKPRFYSPCACGEWFEHKNMAAMGCQRCAKRRERQSAKARGVRYRAQRGPFTCSACGRAYYTDKRKGQGEKYCSRECAFADGAGRKWSKSSISARYTEHLHAGYRLTACTECAAVFAPVNNESVCSPICVTRRVNRWAREKWLRRWPRGRALECEVCLVVWCPLPGWANQRTCSEDCRDRANRKHACTHRQRARKRGVRYEPVDRVGVFERDDWTCRACGCATPAHLVGTYDDNAPELDHIVPFALGGDHIHENVQTLCRVCNWLKGAMEWDRFVALYGERAIGT